MEKSFFAQGQCRIINMTAKTSSNAHDLPLPHNTSAARAAPGGCWWAPLLLL